MSIKQYQWGRCKCPHCNRKHIDLVPMFTTRGKRVDPTETQRIQCDHCLAVRVGASAYAGYLRWRESIMPGPKPTKVEAPDEG